MLALALLVAAAPPAVERMRELTAEVNRRTFAGRRTVTCWMCHRGERSPRPRPPFSRDLPAEFARMPPADLARPAELVFRDVRALRGMDGRNFGLLMGWFNRELGVSCAHCHSEAGFELSTPRKERAREMLQMTSFVADRYYAGDSPIGCGTCHAGEPIPLTAPGRRAK